jgi:hypothetical protein
LTAKREGRGERKDGGGGMARKREGVYPRMSLKGVLPVDTFMAVFN